MTLTVLFLAFCAMAFIGLYLIWPAFALIVSGLVGAAITLLIAYNDRGKTQPAAEPADDTA